MAVEDRERAAAVERELFARLLPEAGAALSVEVPAGRCPACGALVVEDQVECPDCGLVVVGAPDEEAEADGD